MEREIKKATNKECYCDFLCVPHVLCLFYMVFHQVASKLMSWTSKTFLWSGEKKFEVMQTVSLWLQMPPKRKKGISTKG